MKSLVVYDRTREAPGGLLRVLREIDAVADLVYFGRGRWELGRVVANRERIRKSLLILEWERHVDHPSADALRVGELGRQGFGFIAGYDIQGEPDARIVEDFRMRDWLFRHDGEAAFQARLSESCGDARYAQAQALMEARIDATAADAWRWAFKNPVSSINPGIPA